MLLHSSWCNVDVHDEGEFRTGALMPIHTLRSLFPAKSFVGQLSDSFAGGDLFPGQTSLQYKE